MSTDLSNSFEVAGIPIQVQRKAIKNIHLAVYPPNGRVKLSAPENTKEEVIKQFAISKLGWLKKQIKGFQTQQRETPREYVTGESHYFRGQRYLLKVEKTKGKQQVSLEGGKKLLLKVKEGATKEDKADLLQSWYREELKDRISDLLNKWEKTIGVKANDWGVRKMRTKWGSCNRDAKRIWLNLELAKKPQSCLEYIIVHELVHFHERNHNDRFIKLMDEFMPKWRLHRKELNSLPVRHEDWEY
ncbi:MAG: M48 family metallopeptidase [Bacteroidota bacterium]